MARQIRTQKQAAEFADVTVRTIRNWQRKGLKQMKGGYFRKSDLLRFKENSGNIPQLEKLVITLEIPWKDRQIISGELLQYVTDLRYGSENMSKQEDCTTDKI